MRQKAARLLIVGFRGLHLASDDPLLAAIHDGLAGVVLFDRDQQTGAVRNIQSPDQLRALISTLRQAAGDRPLLIAVDQEGGKVARLGPQDGFAATPSEAEIGTQDDPAAARQDGATIGAMLSGVGINVDLAPVVDLNVDPTNPSIGALDRSFSADPAVVVELASAEIGGMHGAGVLATLKHFPGLGSATGDTDRGFVDVTNTWTQRELQPFSQLVAQGVPDLVMVANALNGKIDRDHPSTLSRATLDLLRGAVGWDGPVITDDLQAGALLSSYSAQEIVSLALGAGNDLLLFANQQLYEPDVANVTLDTIVGLVDKGTIDEARIDTSLARLDRMIARL